MWTKYLYSYSECLFRIRDETYNSPFIPQGHSNILYYLIRDPTSSAYRLKIAYTRHHIKLANNTRNHRTTKSDDSKSVSHQSHTNSINHIGYEFVGVQTLTNNKTPPGRQRWFLVIYVYRFDERMNWKYVRIGDQGVRQRFTLTEELRSETTWVVVVVVVYVVFSVCLPSLCAQTIWFPMSKARPATQ